ncbi:MAG: PQQ-binding-like beta-propeller repeat protein [Anaerolineales bacterium]
MKKFGGISKVFAVTACIIAIGLGIMYLKLTIPSGRELWRISDKNLSNPIVVSDMLVFEGVKGEFSSQCEYIYAVDKNTGRALWSSETFMDQYCNQSIGSVSTAIILLSEKEDIIFVSSNYWTTDDEQEYILYALSSSDGELLWKVNGYAGYPYSDISLIDYSLVETDYIYVVNKEGLFSALDSSTGETVWQHDLASVDYDADFRIEYNNQTVYYYDLGNQSLIAFDENDGSQLWEVSNLSNIYQVLFSDNSAFLVSWYDGYQNSDSSVIALDTLTGNQIWKLSLKQDTAPWAEIKMNCLYVVTHGGESLFGDFKSLQSRCSLQIVNENTGCSLAVLNGDTGELMWQFNEDYLHGNLIYLVQDNVAYIGTHDGSIFALDTQTGKVIWQTAASGAPFYFQIEKDYLIVVDEKNYVAAYDTATGKQRWRLDVGMDISSYPRYSAVITHNGILYVAGAKKRNISAIDLETGKKLWSWNHNHPRDKAYYFMALDDDILYVDQYRRFLGFDWFFALRTKPD